MKYFCKYLPVEGEIKEGELGLSMDNTIHIYHDSYDEKGQWRKVKLFICSKDIQVGDKFNKSGGLLSKTSEVTEEAILYHINNANRLRPDTYFKVIGEISPEATWIKEGSEFEENECQIGFILDGRFRFIHEFTKLWKSIEDMKDDGINITCKIKGPCGHFH